MLWLWIILAILVIIAVIILIVYFVTRRSKGKQNPDQTYYDCQIDPSFNFHCVPVLYKTDYKTLQDCVDKCRDAPLCIEDRDSDMSMSCDKKCSKMTPHDVPYQYCDRLSSDK